MLSNVNMVFFRHLPPKNDEEFFRQIPSITDVLTFEIKLWFEKVEKILRFFVFEMQLDKEIAFDEIGNFISRLLLDFLEKFLLDDWVNIFIEG